MAEISQLASGRGNWRWRVELGLLPRRRGPDPTCVPIWALQDALAVLLEEDGGPHHPRARIRGPRLRAPPSRPRGDDEQAQAVRRGCEGGVRSGA
jgi:hypothetical protein